MTSTLRLVVAALALLWITSGGSTSLSAGTPLDSCDEVCNPSVPCDTPCAGTTYEEPPETICGNHNGGSANGYCQSTCGDGNCDYQNGEDGNSCESDCAPAAPHGDFVRFPDDGLPWSSRLQNWPDQDAVGHCYGNCGPGCGFYDTPIPICGTPEQYWELTVLSQPQLVSSSQTCFCADGNNLYECGELDRYVANGRWTYHGWKAAGCYTHDTTCRTPWWASIFIGYFGIILTPGGLAADLWVTLALNPFITCRIDFASWVWGGMCAGSGAEEWPYEQTIVAGDFT